MTMFDDEFNRTFKKMSSSFFDIDDIFEEFKENAINLYNNLENVFK